MCVCVPSDEALPPFLHSEGNSVHVSVVFRELSRKNKAQRPHGPPPLPHHSPLFLFFYFALSLPLKPISQRPRTTEKSTTVANAHFKEERKGETVLMRRRRRRKTKGVLEKGFLFGLNTRCEKRVGGEEEESWK